MKTSIAGYLVAAAVEHLREAKSAHNKRDLDAEVRHGIGAQMNIAIATAGIANEIAEAAYDGSILVRFERTDTILKWYFLSTLGQRIAFDPGKEPLQTIQELFRIRNNYIAHPKVFNIGDDITFVSSDGTVLKNAPLDHLLQPGDAIYKGFEEVLELFEYDKTKGIVLR